VYNGDGWLFEGHTGPIVGTTDGHGCGINSTSDGKTVMDWTVPVPKGLLLVWGHEEQTA